MQVQQFIHHSRKIPFFIYLVCHDLFMRQGPSCCRFFRLLPFTHNAPFLFQQERVKHGRLDNLRNPSIFALLCGLADRQQEGKSAATVFIQPGASCCVVGCFVFCHFAHSVLHHCSSRVCPRLWWSLTAAAVASARWAFFFFCTGLLKVEE